LFGEVVYGGHITDPWDRRTCTAYLETILHPDVIHARTELAPGFMCPVEGSFSDFAAHIENVLPDESPALFGMHPSTELKNLGREADEALEAVLQMQEPVEEGFKGGHQEGQLNSFVSDIYDLLPNNLGAPSDFEARRADPFAAVIRQECRRLNTLLDFVRDSLTTLKYALEGFVSISEQMETFLACLRVPEAWLSHSASSPFLISAWCLHLRAQHEHLESWRLERGQARSVWLGGLFQPSALFTAILQSQARVSNLPLDLLTIATTVTQFRSDNVERPPEAGVYIREMLLEGARWDNRENVIRECNPMETLGIMPILHITACLSKKGSSSSYKCPVYSSYQRGPTCIFCANLATFESPLKWVIAGVALLTSSN